MRSPSHILTAAGDEKLQFLSRIDSICDCHLMLSKRYLNEEPPECKCSVGGKILIGSVIGLYNAYPPCPPYTQISCPGTISLLAFGPTGTLSLPFPLPFNVEPLGDVGRIVECGSAG